MRLNCTPCSFREGPAPAGSCVFFSGQRRGRGQAPAQPRVTPAPRVWCFAARVSAPTGQPAPVRLTL